jgi:valyl-tRNA synthetase
MIMFGLKFTGEVPFREIYIHGLVRDSHGQKMSKSKGNVLDPLDLIDGIELDTLIEKRTRGMMQPHLATKISKQTRKDFPNGIPSFGTDALRFTFAALASTGRDIKFDLNRIEGYRNFCNKLWNAARYVLMNSEHQDCGQNQEQVELSLPDRWIISRLQIIEQDVIKAINGYRLDLAAQAIYEFTWNEYCDWYLELSKPVLNNPDSTAEQLRGTRRTLVRVLETILRLAHPVIPFITEEIWQRVRELAGRDGDTIMTQVYPQPDDSRIDHNAIVDIEWLMSFVLGIRKIRSSMNIAPSKPLPVLLQNASSSDTHRLNANRTFLMTLARLDTIEHIHDGEAPESATALVGDMKVLIPMSGLIDKDAELARLSREIDKLIKIVKGGEAKLANPSYVEKAPSHVVAKEQQKIAELRASLDQLQTQHNKIQAL